LYIINADDFGSRSEVNTAVLRSFQEGWVSSTTIMANRPGFDEACQMVAEHHLRAHVGLHLVLTEGVPLTDRIKRERRFCNQDGIFCATRKTRLLHLDTREKEAVAEELRMQILRCRRAGLELTHVDSHHHIHEEIAVLSLVLLLVREFRIPYVRIMNNLSMSGSRTRRTYTSLYNAFLKHCRLSRTDYFGALDQYLAFLLRPSPGLPGGNSFEIMTHPAVDEKGAIRERLSDRPLGPLIEQAGLRWQGKSFAGASYAVGSGGRVTGSVAADRIPAGGRV
jgi:predicted glycoside hydrolase/deacetylase ChbG (UPF0249 family)